MSGARVPAACARAVLEAVASAGGDTERVREQGGLPPSLLERPDGLVDLEHVVRLQNAAARVLDDPSFGLRFGAAVDPTSLGVLSYCVFEVPTLRDALGNLSRYLDTFVEGFGCELVSAVGDPVLRISAEPLDPRDGRQPVEASAALLVALIRGLVDDAWSPREVRFRHAEPATAPAWKQVYREALGAPVRFGASADELHLRRGDPARQTRPPASQPLPRFATHLAQAGAERRGDAPLVARVRGAIARSLVRGGPSIDAVARELGLGPRTLQRRLGEHGCGFRQLGEQLRSDVARRQVVEGDTDLAGLAFLLGYSELSAFDRAFRRWTGQSPRAHRQGRHTGARAAPSAERGPGRPRLPAAGQRERLMAAVWRLLLRADAVSLSVKEVAREARMSTRTFYEHFDSLGQLIVAVVEQATGRFFARVLEVGGRAESAEPAETIAGLIDAYLDTLAPVVGVDRQRIEHATRRTIESHRDRHLNALLDYAGQRLVAARAAGQIARVPERIELEMVLLGIEAVTVRYAREGRAGELRDLRAPMARYGLQLVQPVGRESNDI
ncbi:MAG: AraC family transcriptional regulator ligand-binding domain-containing protein [Myxococcota bacterium]